MIHTAWSSLLTQALQISKDNNVINTAWRSLLNQDYKSAMILM